jgi:glycosyltransferase involved in cell wall biosynthesis
MTDAAQVTGAAARNRFVTAFNGSRDYYEVPLALHELGLLERHVSDMYLPDALVFPARYLYPRALSRHRPGLPSKKVHPVGRALLPQVVELARHRTKAPGGYESIDRSLSLEAAKIASRTESDLFLHSGYALWAFERHPGRRRWLYQFHPHPLSTYDILKEDLAAHPEVRVSFESEIDSQEPANVSAALLAEWQLAEHVFCASAFTARSLVTQGCDAARIHVVPYGSFAGRPHPDIPPSSKRCKFLFVGQGVQRKGIHHLLKAWKMAALSDSDLDIVSRKLDPGVASLLQQPNVRVHLNATSEERDRLYARSDVFAMPSLVEGFGLVYLEAMAAGLYCIGTTNTGLPDLDPPPDVAAIVSAGDIEALAAALLGAHAIWRSGGISKEPIVRFAARRSWTNHRDDMKRVIRSLLDR